MRCVGYSEWVGVLCPDLTKFEIGIVAPYSCYWLSKFAMPGLFNIDINFSVTVAKLAEHCVRRAKVIGLTPMKYTLKCIR